MAEDLPYYTERPSGNEAERLFARGCRSADLDLVITLGLFSYSPQPSMHS